METNANQKVSCVVNYAYDASEPDELTIRPGDIIWDVDRLPGGWWRGELRGRRGMFPDNFVSLPNEHGSSRSVGVQDRCRAVYSYQPANPDELPLCVGDVLEVLGEVEEGWWQGKRQGRVGVFPSNFVVMLDPPQPAPPFEPAPALPPKPVKEQCRVLFPYTAVNEDELTMAEGEVVTIVSKDAPDRGWWRGELHGRVGLFPDNFVQLLPAVTTEIEEKKPERPPPKTTNSIYPALNKHFEKTASVKELTTSKISTHKENTLGKETSTQSTVTHTSKTESEKLIHNETVTETVVDGQVKKPPVPLKKSPTPISSVGGLFSGLKNKMLSSTDKEKEKSSSTTVSSGSSSGGEWDRPDGGAASRPANTTGTTGTAAALTTTITTTSSTSSIAATHTVSTTATFDHIERNSILNDPRAGRVKAPRRRPPSQALRDDTPLQIGLSNGHEVVEKPTGDKAEEIKPRTREWEKHRAPWMEELKLNQAKKTSFGADGKSRSVSACTDPPASTAGVAAANRATSGSTDRILDCGLEEKKTSTHSMEMSKSTSSISTRMAVLENFEETKVRHSLDSKKEAPSRDIEPIFSKPVHSPTAAGLRMAIGSLPITSGTELSSAKCRTLMSMLEEVKKPPAPSPPPTPLTALTPPTVTARSNEHNEHAHKLDKTYTTDKPTDVNPITKASSIFEKVSTLERVEKPEEKVPERPASVLSGERSVSNTLERRLHAAKVERNTSDGTDALIEHLNSRISNLEKLLEIQSVKFKSAIDELNSKLKAESEKRQELKVQLDKLAQCVTQV